MPETNMNNTANVTAGKPKLSGAIFTAPIGTTAPTNEASVLNAAFKCMGFISEDGLTHEITRETETIKDWAGRTVMTSQTEYEEKFTFAALEMLNADVLEVIFGEDNVTDSSGHRQVLGNATELGDRMWVFDMVMSNGKARRIFVPCGRITSIGEISYKNNEAVSSELEITAVPDGDDNCSYTWDDTSTAGNNG